MFKGFKEFTYKMVAGANVATIIITTLNLFGAVIIKQDA